MDDEPDSLLWFVRTRPGEHLIDRERPRSLDQHDEPKRDGQEMILKAFALLLAAPVHEEPIDVVHCRDRNQHVHNDSECRNAAEQAHDESETTEELRTNGEKGQRRRNPHLLGEEAHGALEAVAAKPAQHLLRSVRKERHPEHQAYEGEGQVVWSRNKLAKHWSAPTRKSLGVGW